VQDGEECCPITEQEITETIQTMLLDEQPQMNTVENNIRKFKLPIQYLDKKDRYTLSDTVSNDIELVNSDNKSMYEYLFQPEHDFAKLLIPQWKNEYTTNIAYLMDTQSLVRNINKYKNELDQKLAIENVQVNEGTIQQRYTVPCQDITNYWDSLKNEASFLEKYSFIEWNSLKYMNQSSYFLQFISLLNISSPLITLFVPILFLLLPILLLKVQQISITYETYVSTLKDISRNHVIGKICSIDTTSPDKILYLALSIGFYFIQIYQNINHCLHFYSNMMYINETLVNMRKYVEYSIHSMESYMSILDGLNSYLPFYKEIEKQKTELEKIYKELGNVYEFSLSFNKLHQLGYMMKCFYELYANPQYEECLAFSMGFEGYVNNMLGVFDNYSKNNVAFSSFDRNSVTSFKEQYYPALIQDMPVKNDLDFKKHIILSAPNKSGKTTILKTTTINIIFSQQLGCGFYSSASISPYTHIHSYLNIPDTSGRDSLFQAESRRCKEIIDIIGENQDNTYRHFCIFDELFSGTNPEEASKAGCAVLRYLSKFANIDFMLTTHYSTICKKFKKSAEIQNYKMLVNVLADGTYEYTYILKKGISKIKGGIRVLKDMGYPTEITESI